MDKSNLSSMHQKIVALNLELHAITQDIIKCKGPRSELSFLNEIGREKIVALKTCIDDLDDRANYEMDQELSQKAIMYREQFSKSLQAFRRATVSATIELEKLDRRELLNLKHKGMLKAQENSKGQPIGSIVTHETVTDRMLSVSRHLSETTSKSAATLEALLASSISVKGTNEELLHTAGVISQSGKLLNKYGRRERTDKVLLFCAFLFFLASICYIVHKRLF